VAWSFAGVLGLNRAFALELENEALSGLALARWSAASCSSARRSRASCCCSRCSSRARSPSRSPSTSTSGRWPGAWRAWPRSAPPALCTIGTLFSAIAVRTQYREVMLPLLLLPLLVPVLLGAVRATNALLLEGTLPWPALQLLLVTDGVFAIVSFLTFEVVLDE
jgi:heme exporter protein B